MCSFRSFTILISKVFFDIFSLPINSFIQDYDCLILTIYIFSIFKTIQFSIMLFRYFFILIHLFIFLTIISKKRIFIITHCFLLRFFINFLLEIMSLLSFIIVFIFIEALMIIYDLFVIILLIIVINERLNFGFALLIIRFDFLIQDLKMIFHCFYSFTRLMILLLHYKFLIETHYLNLRFITIFKRIYQFIWES